MQEMIDQTTGKPGVEKSCLHCHGEFVTSGSARYCSQMCAVADAPAAPERCPHCDTWLRDGKCWKHGLITN